MLAECESVILSIGDMIQISGGFAFEMGPVHAVDVNLGELGDLFSVIPGVDNGRLEDVDMQFTSIGISDARMFVGWGGYFEDTNNDHKINDDDEVNEDAIGFIIEDLDMGMVLMKPLLKIPTVPGNYYAISVHADKIGLVGIDDIKLEGLDINFAMNASSLQTSMFVIPPHVDFSTSFEDGQYEVKTGNEPVVIDF